MPILPLDLVADFSLQIIDPRGCAEVASWVPTAAELFMLAPGTPPPLTSEKVRSWTSGRDLPLSLWCRALDRPVAYAELNFMPQDEQEMWIGHLIVAPQNRGHGIGFACVTHLLHRAFFLHRARRVSLVVFPENEIAMHCYLKAGLRVSGAQNKRFPSRRGWHRMLKMTISRRQYLRGGPRLEA